MHSMAELSTFPFEVCLFLSSLFFFFFLYGIDIDYDKFLIFSFSLFLFVCFWFLGFLGFISSPSFLGFHGQ